MPKSKISKRHSKKNSKKSTSILRKVYLSLKKLKKQIIKSFSKLYNSKKTKSRRYRK